jgi:hypothetical protein
MEAICTLKYKNWFSIQIYLAGYNIKWSNSCSISNEKEQIRV